MTSLTKAQIKHYFSNSYAEARDKFLLAATASKAKLFSYEIEADSPEKLTIDVAILGEKTQPALLVSSGVHGVEGFFGSAVQSAFLDKFKDTKSRPALRYIFIHAVNPYGFAQFRRVNEDNVDLNRNFLPEASDYRGAPDGYIQMEKLLNPTVLPLRREPFKLKALYMILRHGGLQTLKNGIAGGQYAFPKGIFYGGNKPSQSMLVIQKHSPAWLGSAQKILHIDLHTGLGHPGTYKVLLTEPLHSQKIEWYNELFGEANVENLKKGEGTAYNASGTLGEWMQHRFEDRDYRFVAVEYGTHPIIKVLAATRAENCLHHYGTSSRKRHDEIKNEFLECFYPVSESWREKVLSSGLSIINQGESALQKQNNKDNTRG